MIECGCYWLLCRLRLRRAHTAAKVGIDTEYQSSYSSQPVLGKPSGNSKHEGLVEGRSHWPGTERNASPQSLRSQSGGRLTARRGPQKTRRGPKVQRGPNLQTS